MRVLVCLCTAAMLVFAVVDRAAAWQIVQLTDNDYDDITPRVSGSNVAWKGKTGPEDSIFLEDDIFLYDGAVRQLTNSSNLCCSGEFSLDGNRVAWTTWDQEKEAGSEVVFFDGQTARQITINDTYDRSPALWNGGVAWLKGSLTDCEVFNYDGTSTVQLTDDDYSYSVLAASGDYVGWATGALEDVNYVMRYDGQTITEVANTAPYDIFAIQLSEENVLITTWQSWSYFELALCTPEGMEELATISANYPSGTDISGSRVVWNDSWSAENSRVYLYDGDQIVQIADNGFGPCISDSFVAWSASDGNDSEIFLYDGTDIMQVTDNDFDDSSPQLSGSTLAWKHWDGNDWEIQMTTVPEPSGVILLLLLGLSCLGPWRVRKLLG